MSGRSMYVAGDGTSDGTNDERRRRRAAGPRCALVALVAFGVLATSCGSKSGDTVVVVALTADPAAPALTSATVS